LHTSRDGPTLYTDVVGCWIPCTLELLVSGDPKNGTLLAGRYRLQSLVSTGGTGRVYRAIQEPMARPVAVKLLRGDFEGERRILFEERFYQEARRAASLQHPNIVTVHDFGRSDDGECFLVMEFLEGRTLRDLFASARQPLDRVLRIFDQVAQGLRHAHSRGIVHRDVKPSNVILIRGEEGDDRAKVLDFGLAEIIVPEPVGSADSGPITGTPAYMAPEQIQGEHMDQRVDVYSLGVMLYQALTGFLPFCAPNTAGTLYLHVHEPFPAMAHRAPDAHVSPALEEICRICLAKRPADRFTDMDAFLTALRQAARRLPGSQAFALGQETPPSDATDESAGDEGVDLPLSRRWGRTLFWAAAVALALIGIWAGAMVRNRSTAAGLPAVSLAPDASGATVDGVAFSPEERFRALQWANAAGEVELQEAGLHPDCQAAILQSRPFVDVSALALPGCAGTDALRAIKLASR
jgi:serine/threonine protein kinase